MAIFIDFRFSGGRQFRHETLQILFDLIRATPVLVHSGADRIDHIRPVACQEPDAGFGFGKILDEKITMAPRHRKDVVGLRQ
jgi:hypothetical protein